jgi:hypothetical protein
MNITGTWLYNEDFEYGKSEGEVELQQQGNEVTGTFSFTEKVENDYEIEVLEKVQGTIKDGKLLLESKQVRALQNNEVIDYLPNTFDIYLISEEKLVGSTYDSEDVCGVFVLKKKI